MALKQELILLILIHQQFCVLWTHKGYHRPLSQNIFLCAYHYSTISVRSFKVGYHSALVTIMPRNLLFQSNVFLHPCCMLKSSERAKLTNYSTKATSQIFTDLFLFVISTTWHFSSLNTEVKAKGVMLQQLLQIFCRLKWKKKKYFSQLVCHVGSMTHNPEFNAVVLTDWIWTGPSTPPWLPAESWVGKGFISLSTIFWYKALKLNGSTVKGNVPVNIAYMFTPLKENTEKKKPKCSGTRKKFSLGFSDCTSSLMSDINQALSSVAPNNLGKNSHSFARGGSHNVYNISWKPQNWAQILGNSWAKCHPTTESLLRLHEHTAFGGLILVLPRLWNSCPHQREHGRSCCRAQRWPPPSLVQPKDQTQNNYIFQSRKLTACLCPDKLGMKSMLGILVFFPFKRALNSIWVEFLPFGNLFPQSAEHTYVNKKKPNRWAIMNYDHRHDLFSYEEG